MDSGRIETVVGKLKYCYHHFPNMPALKEAMDLISDMEDEIEELEQEIEQERLDREQEVHYLNHQLHQALNK